MQLELLLIKIIKFKERESLKDIRNYNCKLSLCPPQK